MRNQVINLSDFKALTKGVHSYDEHGNMAQPPVGQCSIDFSKGVGEGALWEPRLPCTNMLTAGGCGHWAGKDICIWVTYALLAVPACATHVLP